MCHADTIHYIDFLYQCVVSFLISAMKVFIVENCMRFHACDLRGVLEYVLFHVMSHACSLVCVVQCLGQNSVRGSTQGPVQGPDCGPGQGPVQKSGPGSSLGSGLWFDRRISFASIFLDGFQFDALCLTCV